MSSFVFVSFSSCLYPEQAAQETDEDKYRLLGIQTKYSRNKEEKASKLDAEVRDVDFNFFYDSHFFPWIRVNPTKNKVKIQNKIFLKLLEEMFVFFTLIYYWIFVAFML